MLEEDAVMSNCEVPAGTSHTPNNPQFLPAPMARVSILLRRIASVPSPEP